jgi:hypothetical protein
MYYFWTSFGKELYMFRTDLRVLSIILTLPADSQHNQYDKYLLLCLQY